jgi:hypothetical protein
MCLFCVGQDGDSWQLSACASCQCDKGVVKCAHVDCALSTVGAAAPGNGGCARNFRLAKLPGKCCPECVESKYNDTSPLCSLNNPNCIYY